MEYILSWWKLHLLTSQIEIPLRYVPHYSVNKALMMVSLYTDRTCVLMFSQIFAALFGPLRGYIYVGSSNIPFRAAKTRYYSLKKQAFVQINIVSITYFSYTSIKWWLQEEIAVIC